MSGSTRANGAGQVASQWDPDLLELGTVFRRVARALKRLRGRDTHLGGSELSHAQFELLGELFERGELPAGGDAELAGLVHEVIEAHLFRRMAIGGALDQSTALAGETASLGLTYGQGQALNTSSMGLAGSGQTIFNAAALRQNRETGTAEEIYSRASATPVLHGPTATPEP